MEKSLSLSLPTSHYNIDNKSYITMFLFENHAEFDPLFISPLPIHDRQIEMIPCEGFLENSENTFRPNPQSDPSAVAATHKV
jgi:hypothetical protein